nr:hypothetical protein HUO10_004583 [Paraburkholderia busanensis]
MLDAIYTVEEAADRLRLHPKTVLRFIREERLRATRVGKAYRIQRADLEAFAGVPAEVAARPMAARVTSIAEVPDASQALHQYIAQNLQAALTARTSPVYPIHLETIFDPAQRQLKIVIIAASGDAAVLLGMLGTLLDAFQP